MWSLGFACKDNCPGQLSVPRACIQYDRPSVAESHHHALHSDTRQERCGLPVSPKES